jgi:predicted Fe-Mo cluster-binding NifX family protein
MVSNGPGAEFKAVENTARGLGNGAGIQAAQTLANMRIEVVLTGDLGPNAFRVLNATGIRAFRTNSGTVEQAASEIEGPTGPGHHGGGGHGPRWQEQRGPR